MDSMTHLATDHTLLPNYITYLLVHLFTNSFIHSFIRSFIHSFVHSFIHSFIHQTSHEIFQVPRWRGGGGLAQRHRGGPEELAADPLRGRRAAEMGETRRAQPHRAAHVELEASYRWWQGMATVMSLSKYSCIFNYMCLLDMFLYTRLFHGNILVRRYICWR